MSSPAPTRVDRLPVRLDSERGSIQLFVGDRKVASAWGPAVDNPDEWFLWNGYRDPYRISGGRDGAMSLIEYRRDEWQRREDSLWHPDHGPLGDSGYISTSPAGASCIGCGMDLSDRTLVATVEHTLAGETTWHYICDHCHAFGDDEDGDTNG